MYQDATGFDVEATKNPNLVNGNFVEFEMFPMLNESKSWGLKDSTGKVLVEGAGREIYDEVEFIRIVIPGDLRNIVHRPVEDIDKRRYATKYAEWKAGRDQNATSGTPLQNVPWMSRSLVKEATFLGLKTIEQLAEVSDGNVQSLGMGWMQLRQRARDWLEQAKGGAGTIELRKENEVLRSQLEALQRQVQELSGILESKTKPKRGGE